MVRPPTLDVYPQGFWIHHLVGGKQMATQEASGTDHGSLGQTPSPICRLSFVVRHLCIACARSRVSKQATNNQ
jgi:hypothetical protein